MDTLKLLGASVNCTGVRGRNPLHSAALNGHVESVRWLLENGGNTDAKTNNGKTPLDFAEMRKHDEVAEILRRG